MDNIIASFINLSAGSIEHGSIVKLVQTHLSNILETKVSVNVLSHMYYRVKIK